MQPNLSSKGSWQQLNRWMNILSSYKPTGFYFCGKKKAVLRDGFDIITPHLLLNWFSPNWFSGNPSL